jgi:hypothetical protein
MAWIDASSLPLRPYVGDQMSSSVSWSSETASRAVVFLFLPLVRLLSRVPERMAVDFGKQERLVLVDDKKAVG